MKPQEARRQLLDINDRVAKICIGFGEGRIPKDQFDSACKKLNEAGRKILLKAKML